MMADLVAQLMPDLLAAAEWMVQQWSLDVCSLQLHDAPSGAPSEQQMLLHTSASSAPAAAQQGGRPSLDDHWQLPPACLSLSPQADLVQLMAGSGASNLYLQHHSRKAAESTLQIISPIWMPL